MNYRNRPEVYGGKWENRQDVPSLVEDHLGKCFACEPVSLDIRDELDDSGNPELGRGFRFGIGAFEACAWHRVRWLFTYQAR